MGVAITFEDYTPTIREDQPWTGVIFQEANDPLGPFVEIDSHQFTDPDPDPTEPATRTFTTAEGTLNPGWYQIVWIDAGGNREETTPLLYPPPAWIPSVADVGSLVRTRTLAENGEIIGTFTETTGIKRVEVERLINIAIGDVKLKVNPDFVVPKFYPQYKSVVAVAAAMALELTFFPEQVATGRSPYAQLEARYLRLIGDLSTAAADPDEFDAGPEAGYGEYASYGGFPLTAIGMEHPW